jgi:internalin A
MSKDLQIISQLEKQIGFEIPFRKEVFYRLKIGYRLKGDVSVTGLTLPNLELIDISLIEKLQNLTELYLSHNLISEIYALESLKSLNVLWLNNNQINDISPIQKLTHLRELWINDNHIKSLNGVRNLDFLVRLISNNNKISDISPLEKLSNLEVVDLRDNPIEELPIWVIGPRSMDINWFPSKVYPDGLTLYNNPLINPPAEIVQLGKNAIEAWFESPNVTSINETKILFVGNGGAGKTTIIKCLTGNQPDSHEGITDRIQITSDKLFINGDQVLVNYWDFGGQEVMHSTHQFFFSQHCLYVIVIDARHQESPEYWLTLIESVGGESPVIIVVNKADLDPNFELDQERLKEKYSFISEFYHTSCTEFAIMGITDLYGGIENTLNKTQLFKRKWPTNWIEVKRALSEMKENFVSQSVYKDICIKNSIYDTTIQNLLAEYLHDIGSIVYTKGMKQTDMHILKPQWASTAAYKIITSKELSKKRGVFHKDDLLRLLRKEENQEFEYPLYTFNYIVALMEKFELCFSLPGKGHYLVPDLLSIQRPQLPAQDGEVLRFVFEYQKILPQSIITRFIVRMHNDIVDNKLWRTGVVIRLDILDGIAIIMADTCERRIYINVSGEDRREYLSIIRRTFEEIHSTYQKLIVSEKIDLSESGTAFVNYKELQGINTMKETTYISGELKRRFDLTKVFEKIEPANKRTHESLWDVFIVHASLDKTAIYKIIEDLKARNVRYWIDDEQINPGNQIIPKIMEGLSKSSIIIPCISKNQTISGWCQKEYTSVLHRVISGMTEQKIAPLILDNTPDEKIPPFLSDLKCERYLDPSSYKRFLDFLERNRIEN